MRLLRILGTGMLGLLRFIGRPESVYAFVLLAGACQIVFFEPLRQFAKVTAARFYPQSTFYDVLQIPLFVLVTAVLLYAGRRMLRRRGVVNIAFLIFAVSLWNYQKRWTEIAAWSLRPYFPALDQETFLVAVMLLMLTVAAAILYRLLSDLLRIVLAVLVPVTNDALAMPPRRVPRWRSDREE